MSTNRRVREGAVGDTILRRRSTTSEVARLARLRGMINPRFLAALVADFEAHGAEALAEARRTRPATYLRLAAALLPQEAPAPTPEEAARHAAIARLREAR
jgi:hypothetical protein